MKKIRLSLFLTEQQIYSIKLQALNRKMTTSQYLWSLHSDYVLAKPFATNLRKDDDK